MTRITGVCMAVLLMGAAQGDDPRVNYDGFEGPGKGKHVVLIAGDEEYRSEETLPQLAKILAKHHGFKCTVLFAIDPKDGTINPNNITNVPGLQALKTADLMVIFLRWRDLPDEQMAYLAEYIESGKPIIGLRTATHAFNFKSSKTYQKYQWNNSEGGFGRKVLGETWVSHHGNHGTQSTRGIVAPDGERHPILRGIAAKGPVLDIWGPTDVYGLKLPLPGDSQPLVLGQVLAGMEPTSEPVKGRQNEPMMPIAWTRTYKGESGKTARVFTTTMGASQDFKSEGLRRLLVNASYWALGMEERIQPSANVDIVGTFNARPFKHKGFQPGVRPADLQIK